MQADTMLPTPGDVQAWDRYAYVMNNPIRYIDPTGQYGKEVHYDMTYNIVYEIVYQLALEIGYTEQIADTIATNTALEVANSDESADYIPEEMPPNLYERTPNSIFPEGSETTTTKLTPHWYTTDQATDIFIPGMSLWELGQTSHAFQDSYAHWQKLGSSGLPEDTYWGHSKNLPYGFMCGLLKIFCDKSIDTYTPLNCTVNSPNSYSCIDKKMQENYKYLIWDYFTKKFIVSYGSGGGSRGVIR